MVLKHETANNEITLQMTREKLLSIIDDLFSRRLESLYEYQLAYRGIGQESHKIQESPNAFMLSTLSDQAIKESQ